MKRIAVVIAACLLIAGMYPFSSYSGRNAEKPVAFIQPEIKTITDYVTLHGTIENPDRTLLYAKDISTVQEIYVTPGDWVEANQAILRLSVITRPETTSAELAFSELRNTIANGDQTEALQKLDEMAFDARPSSSPTEETYILRSPCDGIVMDVEPSVGASVGTILPCAEICDPKNLSVYVRAGEDVVGKISENMVCSVNIPAFSIQGLSGSVSRVFPYANQKNIFGANSEVQTTVCIAFTHEQQLLRPGYRAVAQIETGKREHALLLPYDAILQDEADREYVMKLENGKIAKQEIETGAELKNRVEITAGLDAEDMLAAHPEEVEEGESIKLVFP